jgi:hypothetical protein
VRVSVLVTLGVCADGRRVVLDLRLAEGESERAWLDAVRSLAARNLGAPALAVIDGNPGLAAAFELQWPHNRDPTLYQSQAVESAGQGAGPSARGTRRRLSEHNLRRKVSASFDEAGDELFTFTAFPIS